MQLGMEMRTWAIEKGYSHEGSGVQALDSLKTSVGWGWRPKP